jgi:broad specificity phosphatase PhoE
MGVVLLVRHGQASFGAADYDVLSDRGAEQAAILGRRLAGLPRIDRVVHGGMRRQEDTARIALEQLTGPAPPVLVDDRFAEYDFEQLLRAAAPEEGAQQRLGREIAAADDPRRAFQEHFERAVTRWTGGGSHDDYEESFPAFCARVRAGLTALLRGLERSETVVVVTSGGVIGAIAADYLGLDAERWSALNRMIVNTSITKLVHGRSGTNLLTVNDHAHLEGERRDLLTYR